MNGLMMNVCTLLIIAAVAVWFSSLITMQPKLRWGVVAVVVVLTLIIPVAGSNPWSWLSGATGELSIVTMILLTAFTLRQLTGHSVLETQARRHLYYLVLVAGLLLYPATLGLSLFDPYTLGFGFVLSLILLSLAIIYWIRKQQQLAVVLLIVVSAHELGLLSSRNTWDYLLDPLLWLFSPVLLIVMFVDRRKAATA
jgi:hypothetical protein